MKIWKTPAQNPALIDVLARETALPRVLCDILAARGLTDAAQAQSFLSDEHTLADPFTLADMDKAVAFLHEAIEDGRKIAVYGDYDCDGITSTVLLTSYLQSVGADVIYYIPDREKDGYGLNRKALDMLASLHIEVIITVDNGISAHEEALYAKELGMALVITDHHTPRDTLPEAVAVINPHRADCPSTFKELAGVGVAFKLVCALEDASGTELLEYYSDLVAIGTVADVVPLLGENRVIVRHGLTHAAQSDKAGVRALLRVCGLEGKALTAESLAFGAVPRINATGRMGACDDAVELLLCDDEEAADEMAQAIDELNRLRKATEDKMLAEIDAMLEKDPAPLARRVIVMWHEGWHHGVVGIVCAKLVDRYEKPCILLSVDGGEARGSGRSVEGFSLIGAISANAEHLTRYGGHNQAAGMTLPLAHVADFADALEQWTGENFPVMPAPVYRADALIDPAQLTVAALEPLAMLEPHGAENPAPLFLIRDMLIDAVLPTSDEKHIRIRFNHGGKTLFAVWFRMPPQRFPYAAGDRVDLLAHLSISEFRGAMQVNIRVRDLRISGISDELQQQMLRDDRAYAAHTNAKDAAVTANADRALLLPDREDFAAAYVFLKKRGGFAYGPQELYFRLLGSGVGYGKLLTALDSLEELGLIRRDGVAVTLLPQQGGKVDLLAAPSMQRLGGDAAAN